MIDVIETVVPQAIVEFNKFESELQVFNKRYDGIVYDLTDPDEEKKARSDKLAIGKVISNLDKTHKELKAPLKAKTDLIDGERKRIKDMLLGVQGKIKGQIEDHEKKEQSRKMAIQKKINDIYEMAVFGNDTSSKSIEDTIITLNNLSINDNFEDRKEPAAFAKYETLEKLKLLYGEKVKNEGEQKELDKLRQEKEERKQQERDERIRKEAKEQAESDAKQAIQNAKDSEERAKREAIEAKERAKEQAKKAAEKAKITERKRIEEKQNREKSKLQSKEKADRLKKENQEHRKKIHTAIKRQLMSSFKLTEVECVKLITSISKGEFHFLEIKY